MVRTVEQAFLAFRATGDAAALAEVFDATAQPLLVLAVHVVRDAALAEDVLQATFLRLIERASSYDPARPWWPWVTGVLVREARHVARQQRRAPDPRRLGSGEAAAAADEAAARELVDQVAAAVARLPASDRAVLTLRLLHGLAHGQIAQALGLPVATVRTRVHRGLKRLRRMLPTTVAVALGRAAVAEVGCVRTVVLARARGAGAGAPAVDAAGSAQVVRGRGTTGSRGLTMKNVLVGSVLVSAASGLATMAWSPGEPVEGQAAAPVVRVAAAASRAGAQLRGEQAQARSPVEPVSQHAGWRLVGRITADGERVAGARVQAWWMRGAVRSDAAEVRSDAEGHYAIDLTALQALTPLQRAPAVLHVRARTAGFAWSEGETSDGFGVCREPTRTFRVDVALRPGCVVRGRVRTPDGCPVAGAVVELRRKLDPPTGTFVSAEQIDTIADEHGTFECSLHEAGAYTASVGTWSEGVVSLELGRLPVDDDRTLPDLVLEGSGAVAGRALAADGSPAAGLGVEVVPAAKRAVFFMGEFASPLYGDRKRAAVDAAGRFSFVGLQGPQVVRVRDAFLTPQEWDVMPGDGARPLVVRGQVLTVRVRDAAGRALPGASLAVRATRPEPRTVAGDDEERRFHRTAVREEVMIDRADGTWTTLAPFGSTWTLCASVPGGVAEERIWSAEEGVATATVDLALASLESRRPVRLSVVDDLRQPVGEWVAELRGLLTHTPIATWAAGETPRVAPGRYELVVESGRRLLDLGRDGQRGLRQLRANPPASRSLLVAAAGAVEAFEADGDGGETTVSVVRGGFLRVHLHGEPAPPRTWFEVRVTDATESDGHAIDVFVGDDGEAYRHDDVDDVPVLVGEGIAAGRRWLRFTAHGFEPVEQYATIEPGAITDVDVTMRARAAADDDITIRAKD